MKAKEKRLIFVLLLLLVIIVVVKVKNGEKSEVSNDNYITILADGTKVNTNEDLKQTKMFGDLEFTDIQLTNKDGQTILLANVKNTGNLATEMKLVSVIMLAANGEKIVTVDGIIPPLEVGETTQFNINMMQDYTEAYDFQIIEKGE